MASHPATERYTLLAWCVCGLALLVLAAQPPFGLGDPDSSFHMAKILRAQEGAPFVDPFVGSLTLYPAAFHAIFGNLNRVLGWEPYYLQKFIELLQWAMLLLGFYFFARSIIKSSAVLACSLLALSLVFYAPTGRYILECEPANSSFGPMFFGLGLIVRYHLGGRRRLLFWGSLLLGLATVIWWYHLFTLPFFAAFLVARTRPLKPWPVCRDIALSGLVFSLPLLFEVWHFYSIRSVLPAYAGLRASTDMSAVAWLWLKTLVTKGNDQFFHYLSPWEALRTHHENWKTCGFYVARSLLLAAQYWLVMVPFNIVLFVFSIRHFRRLRADRANPQATLIKHLLYATILAAVFSVMVQGDLGKMRRCQFVISVVLLAVGMEGIRLAWPNIQRSRWFRMFFAVALGSMLLTVLYTPQLVTRQFAITMSGDTRALIRFIEAIPDHQDERIFLYPENVRVVAPYVSFSTLLAHDAGPTYYHAAPAISEKLLAAYHRIAAMDGAWRNAVERLGIRYMVFSKKPLGQISPERFQEQLAMLKFYRPLGKVVLENDTWVVLALAPRRLPTTESGSRRIARL
jgi:hypothetical protein